MAEAGSWLVALALGVAAVAAWVVTLVEPDSVDAVRLGLVVVVSLFGLGALVRGSAPWRRYRRDEGVARWVERVVPSLEGGVVSCVELERRLESDRTSRAFAPGLVEALAIETASRLSAVPPSRLVPLGPAGRALAGAASAAVVVFGLALLFEPMQLGFQTLALGSRTPVVVSLQHGQVYDVLVGDIDYTLSYPAYTREPPRSIRNSNGDVAALIGTRVHVETRSLVPAVAAAIVFDGGPAGAEPLPAIRLDVGADGSSLTGEFTVKVARSFRFQITTHDSGLIAETRARTLEALPDHPPEADIVEPEADLEVRSTDPVRVTFHLADDHGLGGVDIVTQKLSALEPPTRRRVAALSGDRSWVGGSDVDLKRFQLAPGETLRVWVEAYDANTVAESPGRTQSKEIRIRLYSADEQHAENLDAQRALLDAMVDVIADRLESPVTEKAVARFDAAVDAQGKVVRGEAALIARLDGIEGALADDPLATDTIKDAIADMRKRHLQLADVEARQVRDALAVVDDSERPPLYDQLAVSNERGIKELESDIPWLEKLLEEQDNQRLLQDSKSLVSAERELRSLLEQLKKNDDPAARLEIQKRLQDLLSQIDRMGESMQRSARPMPIENMNYDALDASDMRGLGDVRSTVENLMELVRQGRIDDALAAMDRLGQAVQSVASRIEEDAESGEGGAGASVGTPALRRMATEVEKLAARQEALRRTAEELEKSARGQVAARMRDTLAPEIAKEMQALGELKAGFERLDRSGLREDDRRSLDGIERTIDDARETLSHEDIAQAGRLMSEVRQAMDELQTDLENERPRTPPGPNGLGADGGPSPTTPQGEPTGPAEAPGGATGRGGDGRPGSEAGGDSPPPEREAPDARAVGKALSKLRPGARDSERNLDRLAPLPSDLLDRPTQDALRDLGKQQADNAERVRRLQGELDQLESERPGSKGAINPALDRARQAMDDAAKRLGTELQPGRGQAAAGEAGDRLDEARDAINRELGQEREGAGGVGPSASRSKVEIPDAERYTVPKEFREELLKSLKERAPTSYRSLVERYYEALVQ